MDKTRNLENHNIVCQFTTEDAHIKLKKLYLIYPIIFIDAVYFSVKDNHVIKKLAAYVVLGN